MISHFPSQQSEIVNTFESHRIAHTGQRTDSCKPPSHLDATPDNTSSTATTAHHVPSNYLLQGIHHVVHRRELSTKLFPSTHDFQAPLRRFSLSPLKTDFLPLSTTQVSSPSERVAFCVLTSQKVYFEHHCLAIGLGRCSLMLPLARSREELNLQLLKRLFLSR